MLTRVDGLEAAVQDSHHLDAACMHILHLLASLSRVSILVKVCEVSTVRCVEAESPTVLQTRHPSETPQEIVSVGLTHRVIAGAADWGPADVTTEDQIYHIL